MTEEGNVYTWGGGGNSPPNETDLLGRKIGLKWTDGSIKNITYMPT